MSGIVSIILHSLAAFLRRKLKDLHNQGPQNRIFSGEAAEKKSEYMIFFPLTTQTDFLKILTMMSYDNENTYDVSSLFLHCTSTKSLLYRLLMNKSINALRNIMLHFHTSLVAFLLQTSLVVFECNMCYRYIQQQQQQ